MSHGEWNNAAIVENQNVHPHPHYRAPCMMYVEGPMRPQCQTR